jgi:transcriptional regulator with XRE-family HTH domain
MKDSRIKTTKGGIVYPQIARVIARIGADISLARRVRGMAADDFAKRIGISRSTLHRLETGDPGVALNTLAMALHALGRLDAFAQIADASNDHVTIMQMKDHAPKRITKRKVIVQKDDGEGIDAGTQPEGPATKFKGF